MIAEEWDDLVRWTSQAEAETIRADYARKQEQLAEDWSAYEAETEQRRKRKAKRTSNLVAAAMVGLLLLGCLLWGAR